MRVLTPARARRLKGKTCLVRVDFNVERGEDAFRIEAALPTIKLLKRSGARILLLSHRGRPTGISKRFSLQPLLPFLNRRLRTAVRFIPRFEFDAVRKLLATDEKHAVFLLENLRFLPGEVTNDPGLARAMARLGNAYVNEAFSVSHRANMSVVALPRLLSSYAGLRFAEEIADLKSAMTRARKPLVLILGGAKVSDKLGMIRYFLPRADRMLIGGATANTFLKARGMDIGASIFEPNMVTTARNLLDTAGLTLPADFLRERDRILDIGPLTIRLFSDAIRHAHTLIWNGPMGLFEQEKFRVGSAAIAHAVAKSKAFSIVGGGETTELISMLHLRTRIGFLSTGGGAMLEFLSGKMLPGVRALG